MGTEGRADLQAQALHREANPDPFPSQAEHLRTGKEPYQERYWCLPHLDPEEASPRESDLADAGRDRCGPELSGQLGTDILAHFKRRSTHNTRRPQYRSSVCEC